MPVAAAPLVGTAVYCLLAIAALRHQLAQLPPPLHDRPVGFLDVRMNAQGLRGSEEVVQFRNAESFSKTDLDNWNGPPPEIMRVQENLDMNPAHMIGVRDAHDMLITWRTIQLNWTDTRVVVGWRPHIQKHTCTDGSEHEVVHHMNIFQITSGDTGMEYLATHDRGADGFRLPEGYGIPIFPGTPVKLETHFLPPRCWDYKNDPVVRDFSGLDLIVSSELPNSPARIFGVIDSHMHLPRYGGPTAYATVLPRERWMRVAEQGGKEVIAIHLHTHDVFDEKLLEVLGPKGEVRFRSAPERTGYTSTSQSYRTLAEKGWPRLFVEPGQELRVHCTVHKDLEEPLNYGLSHGSEMCSALVVVAIEPTAHTSTPPDEWSSILSLDQGFRYIVHAGRRVMDAAEAIADGLRRLI